MQTKTNISLSFSPPIADWYLQIEINKVKACRSVWGSLLLTYPQSFVGHCHEAMGGTVYMTKLEKVELIDVEVHRECLLEDS